MWLIGNSYTLLVEIYISNYSWLSFIAVVIFYTLATNTELANIEPLFLEDIIVPC